MNSLEPMSNHVKATFGTVTEPLPSVHSKLYRTLKASATLCLIDHLATPYELMLKLQLHAEQVVGRAPSGESRMTSTSRPLSCPAARNRIVCGSPAASALAFCPAKLSLMMLPRSKVTTSRSSVQMAFARSATTWSSSIIIRGNGGCLVRIVLLKCDRLVVVETAMPLE